MALVIPVITIDGPTSSGKGTLAHLLAQSLGWHWLDSGAIYRVFAYAVIQQDIAINDVNALCQLANDLDIRFAKDTTQHRVYLGNEDVSKTIRSETCGMMASKLSVIPEVRQALLARQHAFQQPPGLVTDGRDMGTIVFPHAKLKIFLSASSEERARRRYEQLKNSGINVKLADIMLALKRRDQQDKNRSVAPLVAADDAVVVDSTNMTIEQVLHHLLQLVDMRQLALLGATS